MRPNTSESGIFSTKRNRPVKTSMLTRMLVPKPKKAFQSPGVHRTGLKSDLPAVPVMLVLIVIPLLLLSLKSPVKVPPVPRLNSVTQPKIPPWALIIFRPISWNSGK